MTRGLVVIGLALTVAPLCRSDVPMLRVGRNALRDRGGDSGVGGAAAVQVPKMRAYVNQATAQTLRRVSLIWVRCRMKRGWRRARCDVSLA